MLLYSQSDLLKIALEALRNALYKCSTYLLTYLLTFLPRLHCIIESVNELVLFWAVIIDVKSTVSQKKNHPFYFRHYSVKC